MKQFASFVIAGVLGGSLVLLSQKLLSSEQLAASTSNQQPTNNSYALATGNNGSPAATAPNTFNRAAEASMDAVVHIISTEVARPRNEAEERFYNYFGTPAPKKSSGSGVIISKDGYIVTNNHVIADATEVEVSLNNGRKYKAKVVGVDPNTDLAVIKIDERDLPSINFANSDQARIGDWVLAVGNPMNLTSTVTAGIISAKGRNISLLEGQRVIESFIQTDAAVNPGNSGGALVDMDGRLVGVNTAIASTTGSYTGYSFAVPANLVKKVVGDLIEYGTVKRGVMGVGIADLDNETARKLGLGSSNGVLVTGISPDGGAAKAGIKTGDVIVAVEGSSVASYNQLQEKIGSRNIGDEVGLTIFRSGNRKDVRVRLGSAQ